jgi:predicted N-formylglutamate amidohydrolase
MEPADPPPFEVVNPTGQAPFLLICDHARNRIPGSLGRLGVQPADLERHVAYDIGAEAVSRYLSEHCDAVLVQANYSRLIVDPNRHPGTPSSIPKASEDVVVPGNHDLSPEDVVRREASFFWPYHEAVTRQLDRFRARSQIPALISIHSFTPAFLGFERPWHIGVLWHRDDRIPGPLMKRLAAEPDICVGDNEPYSARSPEGYSVETHADNHGYPNVLIEIRQDLIATNAGVTRWGGFMAHVLHEILADPAIFTVRRFDDDVQ